jgi:glucuronoarabinoxylan endo-1,4-beta-xylanase
MYRNTRRLLTIAVIGFATFAGNRAAQAAEVAVDLTATKQSIRGFGASSAWCGTISTSIMNSLYKDLGYSILRVRIEEGIGDAWSSGSFSAWAPELANAKNAVAGGAIVFASPWNPPASMKSGGKLITSKYGDYAKYLLAYAKYFADNGAPLYAISIQNEPDYAADWTAWTATDLLNFLKEQGATLSASVKVMMPESFQFRHPMSDPSLNDATVASYISIIGGHLYGAGIATYPLATNQGKELWQTEHYFDDDTIGNVMKLGKEIHDCMVTASMNAYVYWWITWDNGLAKNSTVFKRAYALGQFAKYIRPGYVRVDATASPATNVSVSAYKGTDKVVIVAVNTGTAAVNQSFAVRGGTVSQVSSWQTSASSNMAAGQAYDASGGSFTASLPGQSITTFVGSLSGVVVPDGGAGGVSGNGGASGPGGRSGVGGRTGAGGASGNGGTTALVTGGSLGSGGRSGPGGRSGAGGMSGVGGATVTDAGGSLGSGGRTNGSGGELAGSGGATNAGGAAGGSSAGGTVGAGGDNAGGTTTHGNAGSGCSCAFAGRDARVTTWILGAAIAALIGLRRLARARKQGRAG